MESTFSHFVSVFAHSESFLDTSDFNVLSARESPLISTEEHPIIKKEKITKVARFSFNVIVSPRLRMDYFIMPNIFIIEPSLR